ncbi:Quinone oxidoreductase-like protein [Escovopsis weberi]|uniref:Quinone oxidoreductase-like protein n=1 Tax=Escovopsis weberi TaxID=150374 RepID=A0A0M9VVF8_ESCWE|nr:Quinone oxidoreductase-like protein [Escovopsis weberi]
MMRAVQVLGDPDSPQVVLASVPKPDVKRAEILIRVHAAGVTADELRWPGLWRSPSRLPGHEISGTVAALGPAYSGPLRLGDPVFAMLHAAHGGLGQADFVIVGDDEIALKPAQLSHPQAAALPMPVLIAWEAACEHANLRPGMRVLVTGAAGAVGSLFVQIAAKRRGADVVALAAPQDHDRLRRLGAGQVIDYADPGWDALVGDPVDVVFDVVGDDVLLRTWETIKSDGLLITVRVPPDSWDWGRGRPEQADAHPNVRWMHFIVTARWDGLAIIAALISHGSFDPIPVINFPYERAVEAYEVAAQRNKSGKVVIEFVEEAQPGAEGGESDDSPAGTV